MEEEENMMRLSKSASISCSLKPKKKQKNERTVEMIEMYKIADVVIIFTAFCVEIS